MTTSTELQSAIAYFTNFVECMEDEGLDRDDNARHYHALLKAASRTAALERALEIARTAIQNSISVMDEAGRSSLLKELTDAELGKMWVSVVKKSQDALTEIEIILGNKG